MKTQSFLEAPVFQAGVSDKKAAFPVFGVNMAVLESFPCHILDVTGRGMLSEKGLPRREFFRKERNDDATSA
jgi:hypothetical protein